MNKELNKHDYDGQCTPGSGNSAAYNSFSVGIFKWVAKSGGNGLKRTKAIVRVKGSVSAPQNVYEKAKEICEQLDNGTYNGKKTITV